MGRIRYRLCDAVRAAFERDIEFEFFARDPERQLSDKMKRAVADVLALPPSDISKIGELLWEEAMFACTVADYGAVPDEGETHLQAHLRHFGLATSQDALDARRVTKVQKSQNYNKLEGVYAEIKVESATGNMISMIVKDGVLVDFDGDGCWLGGFDSIPRASHVNRSKVLNQMNDT